MAMRSAVVIGATGLVGSALVRLLCEQDTYVSVTVITRRPLTYAHKKLDVIVKSFEQVTEKDIPFAHELFCCLGTTIKKAGSREVFEQVDYEYPMQFAALAKNRGIPHMLVISAMGASEKAAAYYSRVKGKLETDLIALQFPRLSIVRPSLLTGARDEFRLGEKIGAAVLAVVNPILIGPLKNIRSIPAQQVALAMLAIALEGKPGKIAIYPSKELLAMRLPVDTDGASTRFDWEKRAKKDEPETVLDEEVVFNRSRYELRKDDAPDNEQ